MKKFVRICVLLFVFCLSLSLVMQAFAEDSSLDNIRYENEKVKLLVTGDSTLTTDPSSASVKLNDQELTDITIKKVSAGSAQVAFLFLVDTTTNHNKMYKNSAEQVAAAIYETRGATYNDTYIVMSFDVQGQNPVFDVASNPAQLSKYFEIKEGNDYNVKPDYPAALAYALGQLEQRKTTMPLEKQFIILVSDGDFNPEDSSVKSYDVKTRLEQSGVSLFEVVIPNSGDYTFHESDFNAMNDFVVTGNGSAYKLDNMTGSSDVNEITNGILNTLNYTFLVEGTLPNTFVPTDNGQYTLNLSIADASGAALASLNQPVLFFGLPNMTVPATPTPSATDAADGSKVQQVVKKITDGSVTIAGKPVKNLYLLLAGLGLIIIILAVINLGMSKSHKQNDFDDDDTPPEPSVAMSQSGSFSSSSSMMGASGFSGSSIMGQSGSVSPSISGVSGFPVQTSVNPSVPVAEGQTKMIETDSSIANGLNVELVQVVAKNAPEGFKVSFTLNRGETKFFGRENGKDDRGNRITGLGGCPSISSKHFSLTNELGNLIIEDTGSTNHTFVDGNVISAKTRLRDGASIMTGASDFIVKIR